MRSNQTINRVQPPEFGRRQISAKLPLPNSPYPDISDRIIGRAILHPLIPRSS